MQQDKPYQIIEDLLQKVKQRNFDDVNFRDTLGGFYFEDYIETPSKYYTSFRVVADAWGKIHTASLLRSEYEKRAVYVTEPNVVDPLKNIFNRDHDIVNLLFRHTKSPFYINTPEIISNFSTNKRETLLNGKKVTDNEDRVVLIQHGIDPDNPFLPHILLPQASRIGRECRRDYPFVGIDFVENKNELDINKKYLFLEANTGPDIYPEDIGMNPNFYTNDDAQLEMMKRVAYNEDSYATAARRAKEDARKMRQQKSLFRRRR